MTPECCELLMPRGLNKHEGSGRNVDSHIFTQENPLNNPDVCFEFAQKFCVKLRSGDRVYEIQNVVTGTVSSEPIGNIWSHKKIALCQPSEFDESKVVLKGTFKTRHLRQIAPVRTWNSPMTKTTLRTSSRIHQGSRCHSESLPANSPKTPRPQRAGRWANMDLFQALWIHYDA